MLVDVITLRRDGAKKSRAELSVVVPERLTLTVMRERYSADGPGGARTTISAYLTNGPWRAEDMSKPMLTGAVLTRVRGDSFILVGMERVHYANDLTLQPQAWWCRVAR